jgi:diadenosine tetraphosphatase ApaH/serine/threonine PP2A family protein phosphatase
MEWTRRTISAATIEWLRVLPVRRSVGDFTLVHGSAVDPTWEYVTSPSGARDSLAATSTAHGLNGHTHVPAAFEARGGRVVRLDVAPGVPLELEAERRLLNPGSVGQPRDRDPRASYLLLDLAAQRATWNRVPYDIESVRDHMRAVGLPDRLIDRLPRGV